MMKPSSYYFLLTSLQGIPIIATQSWDDFLPLSTAGSSNKSFSNRSFSSSSNYSSGSSVSDSKCGESAKQSLNISGNDLGQDSNSRVSSSSFGVTISSFSNTDSVGSAILKSQEYSRESSGLSDITLSTFTDVTDRSSGNIEEKSNRDVEVLDEAQYISKLVSGVGVLLCSDEIYFEFEKDGLHFIVKTMETSGIAYFATVYFRTLRADDELVQNLKLTLDFVCNGVEVFLDSQLAKVLQRISDKSSADISHGTFSNFVDNSSDISNSSDKSFMDEVSRDHITLFEDYFLKRCLAIAMDDTLSLPSYWLSPLLVSAQSMEPHTVNNPCIIIRIYSTMNSPPPHDVGKLKIIFELNLLSKEYTDHVYHLPEEWSELLNVYASMRKSTSISLTDSLKNCQNSELMVFNNPLSVSGSKFAMAVNIFSDGKYLVALQVPVGLLQQSSRKARQSLYSVYPTVSILPIELQRGWNATLKRLCDSFPSETLVASEDSTSTWRLKAKASMERIFQGYSRPISSCINDTKKDGGMFRIPLLSNQSRESQQIQDLPHVTKLPNSEFTCEKEDLPNHQSAINAHDLNLTTPVVDGNTENQLENGNKRDIPTQLHPFLLPKPPSQESNTKRFNSIQGSSSSSSNNSVGVSRHRKLGVRRTDDRINEGAVIDT